MFCALRFPLQKEKKECMKNYVLANPQGKLFSFQELREDCYMKPIGKGTIENISTKKLKNFKRI
jgi:hypothetical protein